MKLAVNGLAGLRILRDVRRRDPSGLRRRIDPPAPDPAPRKRWTTGALPLDALLLSAPPTKERPLDVAVPKPAQRLGASFARNTVYGAGLRAGSFIDVGNGVAIPSPELLFVDMVGRLRFPVLVLLGYELCGTFGRDPADPMMGTIAFGIEAATSVGKIREFLGACTYLPGKEDAYRALAYVADNAWSPMEAVLATMLTLPLTVGGYGLGEVRLNVRHENPPELVVRGCPESRVPDIELAAAPVGFNYDGRGHYDLQAVAAAADGHARAAAIKAARGKYVDDLRRNRELMAMGKMILPVCSEDLFEEKALDALVVETLRCVEAMGVEVPGFAVGYLASAGAAKRRQELLWSMLPWSEAQDYARELERKSKALREWFGGGLPRYSL